MTLQTRFILLGKAQRSSDSSKGRARGGPSCSNCRSFPQPAPLPPRLPAHPTPPHAPSGSKPTARALRTPRLPLPSPPSPAAASPQPPPPPSQASSQASPARSSHLPASPLSSHRRSRTLHPRLRAASLARPPLPASGLAVRREAPPPAGRHWPLCPSGGLAGRRAVGGRAAAALLLAGRQRPAGSAERPADRGAKAPIVAGSPRRGAGGQRGRAARRGPSGSHERRRVRGR